MIKTFFTLYGKSFPADQFRVCDFPYPLRVDDSLRPDVIINCSYVGESIKDILEDRNLLVVNVEYGVDEDTKHYQLVGLNVI